MSYNHGIFPTRLSELNTYFSRVIAHLIANAPRLMVSAQNINAAELLYSNPGAKMQDLGWVELWALYINPLTHSSVITSALNKRIKKPKSGGPDGLQDVLRNIFSDIPQSLLTLADRKTLNLKARKGTRTTHNEPTKNLVRWTTIGLGGGDVLTKCHPSGPAKDNPGAHNTGNPVRAHKEQGYDIRTVYFIIDINAQPPSINEGDSLLDLPGAKVVVDTKAHMVRHLGTKNVGKMLVEYKQWHNPSHPNLDGPWRGPQFCIIS